MERFDLVGPRIPEVWSSKRQNGVSKTLTPSDDRICAFGLDLSSLHLVLVTGERIHVVTTS